MTDTLTLTEEYAYGNDFEVRLKALSDLAKRLVPRWHWINYGRDKLCLVGYLGSKPRLASALAEGRFIHVGTHSKK